MLVSIIIPVFNGIKYIRNAVYSALDQQGFRDFEVIAVDDGSTDDTTGALALIQSMNEDRLRVYRQEKNAGPASALNIGIKNAKGDFIKWLSADDMLYPYSLKRMMDYISKLEPEEIKNTIFYTHYRIIDENGNFKRDLKEPGHPESYLWERFFGNGSSSLIHKNVFEKCGLFDEGLLHSEDYEFWLRATQIYGVKMHLIPEFLLMYRNHPDQLTHKVGGTLDNVIKEKIRERQVIVR